MPWLAYPHYDNEDVIKNIKKEYKVKEVPTLVVLEWCKLGKRKGKYEVASMDGVRDV